MKEEMEKGWYLLPNKKCIAKKRIIFISTFLAILGIGRTTLAELYSMIKRTYQSPNNITNIMAFKFPLDHDNFQKPDNYPFYYRLINGWKIENKSKTFLKDGPLFSEDSTKVIVHSKVFVKSIPQQLWKFIVGISSIVGIIAGLITILQFLTEK
jgi:hypothetical protein